MGQAARRRIETNFNLETTTRSLAGLFLQLARERAQSPSFMGPVWSSDKSADKKASLEAAQVFLLKDEPSAKRGR
jgi:hypothetical protein